MTLQTIISQREKQHEALFKERVYERLLLKKSGVLDGQDYLEISAELCAETTRLMVEEFKSMLNQILDATTEDMEFTSKLNNAYRAGARAKTVEFITSLSDGENNIQ